MKNILKKILPKNIKVLILKTMNFFKKKNTRIPKEELEIFKLIKDHLNIVFDVGAREDISYLKIKKDCIYHLFEPNKNFFNSLEKKVNKIKTNEIIINNFGLSDIDEDNCIYYKDAQSFIKNPHIKNIDEGQRYSLKKLDDYVNKNKIPYIDFLKIDTEGMDYRIISGGIETIKAKTKYIQFEYWDGVKKFSDKLNNTFDLFLMIEPNIRRVIYNNDIFEKMSPYQKDINYNQSLIPLNKEVVSLIDNMLIPKGCGGNIFGIKKGIKNNFIKKFY